MPRGRLEAFTDGVMAVTITIWSCGRLQRLVGAGGPVLLPTLIYGLSLQLTAAPWLLPHHAMVRLRT